VILMNPPFGEPSKSTRKYIDQQYPLSRSDMYASFVERGLIILADAGKLGAITSRTGFFLSSLQKWREKVLLAMSTPETFADLGFGILDAMVETAAYTLSAGRIEQYASFFRLLAEEAKGSALAALVDNEYSSSNNVYCLHPISFSRIPGSPFAYWTSGVIRDLFSSLPSFEGRGRTVKQGLATADDFRFVRAWWEVPTESMLDYSIGPDYRDECFGLWCREQTCQGKRWIPFAKGGEYSPYYADIHLVVNWANCGGEIKARINDDTGRPLSNVWQLTGTEVSFFFKSGLTWPRRTNSNFGIRLLPSGTIFADKGPAAFVPAGEEFAALGLLFSQPYQTLIEIRLAAGDETQSGTPSRSYEVGIIQKLPWPDITRSEGSTIASLVSEIVKGIAARDLVDETTRLFLSLPLVGRSPLGGVPEVVEIM